MSVKSKSHKTHLQRQAARQGREKQQEQEVSPVPVKTVAVALGISLIAMLWSYWPRFQAMAAVWASNADYSHGYLVVPLAILFLYVRRGKITKDALLPVPSWGLLIVLVSLLMRFFGGRLFYEPVEDWSLMVWLAGAVIALAGWQAFRWSLPAIVFLLFMMQLPFTIEVAMRQPLQALATNISSTALVMLGYPAIAEANVIRIGDVQYGVAEACSGLRIFVGIAALAFAYVMLIQRHWLVKGVLILAVLPVTLLANSIRIVGTCVAMEWSADSDRIQQVSHDLAGFLMIPLAALMFGAVLWYLGLLLREEPVFGKVEAVRSTSHHMRRSH